MTESNRPLAPATTRLADEMHRAALELYARRDAVLMAKYDDSGVRFVLVKQPLPCRAAG